MKKLLSFTLLICLLLCSTFMVTSCKESTTNVKATLVCSNQEMVVIKIDSANDNAKLIDALEDAKCNLCFNYEISGGMITSVNGIQNKADWSYSWMIYTNDADFSNSAWGTVTYNEMVFGSAILGAEDLPVSSGCYYILYYSSF